METSDQAIAAFLQVNQGKQLESTFSQVVEVQEDLYNVRGSTPDPKIDGLAWKRLLIHHGIDAKECYVTHPPTTGKTHPAFSVGGHMTSNADGIVPVGEESYLMPLCHGHNQPSNHDRFRHRETRMLKLHGFMQTDVAITFIARMNKNSDFIIIRKVGDQLWDIAPPRETSAEMKNQALRESGKPYVLFRKVISQDGQTRFEIESAKI